MVNDNNSDNGNMELAVGAVGDRYSTVVVALGLDLGCQYTTLALELAMIPAEAND
jgi:hypothetical protein